MVQRFFIRLILFGLVSMAGSALILSLLFCEIPFSLWGEVSCLLLCIIYSGRLVIYHLGPTFNALLRYYFVSLSYSDYDNGLLYCRKYRNFNGIGGGYSNGP